MDIKGHDSQTVPIAESILSASFVRRAGAIHFSKTEVAKTPRLVFEAAAMAADALDVDIDAICILATSGIPFGCVLSRVLGMPLHFFRRHRWSVSIGFREVEFSVLPPVRAGARIVLADSHMRSGHTAASCHRVLTEVPDVRVLAVLTLVGLDHLGPRPAYMPVPELPVASITRHSQLLASILGVDEKDLLAHWLTQDSPIWQPGPHPVRLSPRWRPRKRLRSVLSRPGEYPKPEVVDVGLARTLGRSPKFGTDLGVWDLFSSPSLIGEIARTATSSIDWSQYDAIVGVCAIGSALAWVLAYEARFEGPVLSCYESPRIVPPPGDTLAEKRVLLVQGRIITAQDTEEALGRVERAGGLCEDVLAFWWSPETGRTRRCAPLLRLYRKRIRFFALGGL